MTEPNYYNIGGLSPLKAFEKGLLTHEEYVGFIKGNIIKYVIRMSHKTSDVGSDCDKIIDYVNHLRNFYNNANIENTGNNTNAENIEKREKNCGLCKNYNIDGMFGIWCSKHETPTNDLYCSDFERNK